MPFAGIKKYIQGLQLDQIGMSTSLSIGSYRYQELELLDKVLTTLHKKQPRKEAIKALGELMHYENVVTLAALADRGTFDIPELQEALCEGLESMLSINLGMHHDSCWLMNRSLDEIKKEYRDKASSDECRNAHPLACFGLQALCALS